MRPFRIVTHRNWLAEAFKPFGAVQDFGFDIDPATALETLWWAPGAWVASARKAGVDLPLLSCGPRWLDRLDTSYTRRRVETLLLEDVPLFLPDWVKLHDQVFVKLPEAKVDSFPAALHGTKFLADNLAQYRLPGSALVQIQEPVTIMCEERYFIANGRITANSLYKFGEQIWGSDGFDLLSEYAAVLHWRNLMHRFACDVVAEVAAPPGWVLDVGLNEDGDPLVIEANAAWSSSPYDADPQGVIEALTAAHDFEGQHPEWAWRHNPVFDSVGALRTPSSVVFGG